MSDRYGVVAVGDLVKLTPRGRPWLVTGFKAGPDMAFARITPHGWSSPPATVAVDRLIIAAHADTRAASEEPTC